MVFQLVIAGETRDEIFARICLLADHLSRNLPNFCYDVLEIPVLEWEPWLCKINKKNKWHHIGSPLIWKELLMQGSKAVYIGGASEFLEYCHSYYNFDTFIGHEKFEELVDILSHFQEKSKIFNYNIDRFTDGNLFEEVKDDFVVSISGASHPLTTYLTSELLDLCTGMKSITKIYLYDNDFSQSSLENIERECSYIQTNNSNRVIKYIGKFGSALALTDLLIIMDHVIFNEADSVGNWLYMNKMLMKQLGILINASASRKIRIVFPNFGPSCYNATILSNEIFDESIKDNIIVATSDLGFEAATVAAEIAEVPLRNIFCPPVWGFVGINHLVDIQTTTHKYNMFLPYKRHIKVKNSTLTLGELYPEMRTLEYLMYFDETLWVKIAERKMKIADKKLDLNKARAILDVVKKWFLIGHVDEIVNLGIRCNGTFGLNFSGIFSQPSRLVNKKWIPASNFSLPRDHQMQVAYLESMAELVMKLNKNELPPVKDFIPCILCKKKYYGKKESDDI